MSHISLRDLSLRDLAMAEHDDPPAFALFKLPLSLLDLVVGRLDLWDRAAARSACRGLRAAVARRAKRLLFSPPTLQSESDGDQVGLQRAAMAWGRCGKNTTSPGLHL
jgi:hypothetical protein